MAALTSRSLFLLLLAATVVLTFPRCAASISSREYDSMQRVLRSHGYNLICNAMATSDLQYEILTLPPNASFTIFAPTDASLFALDMIQTASSYTDTLRLHLVPLRLSLSDLRSISSGTILPTLLPYTALRLTTTEPLQIAGVDVTLPGLFYSRHVAVHGLAGILSLSSVVSYGSHLPATAPISSSAAGTVSPLRTVSNRTDLSPATATPSDAVAPSTTHSNRSAGVDLSPVSSAGPPSPTPREKISPASDQSPSASPTSANSVPERARVLLMETRVDDNSESDDGDEISKVMEAEAAVGKVKKCGASDEMTIDCFVADEDGDQLPLPRLVRANGAMA